MNEPFWGSEAPSTFEERDLGSLYERVVAAVREFAPQWVAFLEPSASRNLGFSTSLQPFSFPDVVYAPHSYDSLAEGGEGFDEERREALVENYTLFRQEAAWLDAALWIGEYGGIASDPGIAAYMDAQYDGAGNTSAGTCYWTYTKSDGYGMLDADGNEKPDLMGALVRPYPERVAGSPLAYRFDESTRVFTVDFEPDTGISAPTEIIVPTRVYPDGFEVDCGGCSFETEAGRLRLLEPPVGSQGATTVTVRPK
jgi:endoglycosylceramidase